MIIHLHISLQKMLFQKMWKIYLFFFLLSSLKAFSSSLIQTPILFYFIFFAEGVGGRDNFKGFIFFCNTKPS
jgi:hypothetical protein